MYIPAIDPQRAALLKQIDYYFRWLSGSPRNCYIDIIEGLFRLLYSLFLNNFQLGQFVQRYLFAAEYGWSGMGPSIRDCSI